MADSLNAGILWLVLIVLAVVIVATLFLDEARKSRGARARAANPNIFLHDFSGGRNMVK